MTKFPFLLGAQYYRAPTPEATFWSSDLSSIRALGLNCVKFWVQWRWSHRRNDQYSFSDLDQLMDLAQREDLAVHLNVIFDVSPHWLFEKYPDAKQVSADGRVIEPRVVAHRQIGGAPGPCYNHPGALEERRAFLHATVEHFKHHPALAMWDVWNEPELCFPVRRPETYQNASNLVCFCENCKSKFHGWLRRKYINLKLLNEIWGRCYEKWTEVELPIGSDGLVDFVDWREFQQDSLTEEADWRIHLVRTRDSLHPTYLHVVPNTMRVFNSLTGPKDSSILKNSSFYASSGNSDPVQMVQSFSTAAGRIMYNVESHINGGMVNMHQRINTLPDLLRDWLPQIGMGFQGFMFWQYRPEVLGRESPAWGLVDLNGRPRSITNATREFVKRMNAHFPTIQKCRPGPALVGVWKSRKNEFFHYAQHLSLDQLSTSIEAYVNILYQSNFQVRFVSESELEEGALEQLKVLILPSCYYLTEPELKELDAWILRGGTAFVEAHLGAYNGSTGRHARTIPGGDLAEKWGIFEETTTSSYHLETGETGKISDSLSDDVKKALAPSGNSGGKFFSIRLTDESVIWGAERFAIIRGSEVTVEGTFSGLPCIVSKQIGLGRVVYCGTNLGEGSLRSPDGLQKFLKRVLVEANVRPILNSNAHEGRVRVDSLIEDSEVRAMVITNLDKKPSTLSIQADGTWIGIFSQRTLHFSQIEESQTFEPLFVDIFIKLK